MNTSSHHQALSAAPLVQTAAACLNAQMKPVGESPAPKKSKKTQIKIKRRPVHGVLLIDKPLGASSNQVLQRVKWLLKAEKAGHTGTLDPLASGVLPICLGAATKFSQLHLDSDKTYLAIARLGENTLTADAEGEITSKVDARHLDLEGEALKSVKDAFRGEILQTPPMYSALKVDGKALYDYARAGIELELKARAVKIHHLDMTEVKSLEDLSALAPVAHWKLKDEELKPLLSPSDWAPEQSSSPSVPLTRALAIKVTCSKGTYIRTLAQDIGQHLGVGAHLVYLRRVASGDFSIDECMDLQDFEALQAQSQESVLQKHLKPPQCLLSGFVPIELNEAESAKFLSGLRRTGDWRDLDRVAVYAQNPTVLLGSAHTKGGELIPDRLLNPLEINSILESLL